MVRPRKAPRSRTDTLQTTRGVRSADASEAPPPYGLHYTSAFKKDVKREAAGKRAKTVGVRLATVIDLLRLGQPLPAEMKDHALKGSRTHDRECHVLPDLLLIYRIVEEELRLVRLGSHAELFNL